MTAAELHQLAESKTPEELKAELLAAGWVKRRETVWVSPEGDHYIGPFGAWREMKRMEQV